MRSRTMGLILVLGIVSVINVAYAQEQVSTCPQLVSLLIPQMIFHSRANELPRVEVRKCGAGESLEVTG